ncbi:hypothetical protein JCGZ_03968 [Jatropha curcas]|uniref:Uncharacterized protein n=1 Tax=Jatropha curcas TaxID=180498 RepID=A0A067JM71_JATCU|nr:hypothetical protein JCGZ_03968 [Jatropha curcas]
MATTPTDLRSMIEEMLWDQETHFQNMLIEQNDTLRNGITNQRETILREVRTLINTSQNGTASPNQIEGSNDKIRF